MYALFYYVFFTKFIQASEKINSDLSNNKYLITLDDNSFDEFIKDNINVVVLFCDKEGSLCKEWLPKYEKLTKMSSKTKYEFAFVKVDLEYCPKLSQRYAVKENRIATVFENGDIKSYSMKKLFEWLSDYINMENFEKIVTSIPKEDDQTIKELSETSKLAQNRKRKNSFSIKNILRKSEDEDNPTKKIRLEKDSEVENINLKDPKIAEQNTTTINSLVQKIVEEPESLKGKKRDEYFRKGSELSRIRTSLSEKKKRVINFFRRWKNKKKLKSIEKLEKL